MIRGLRFAEAMHAVGADHALRAAVGLDKMQVGESFAERTSSFVGSFSS